jgi:hypothetical protein
MTISCRVGRSSEHQQRTCLSADEDTRASPGNDGFIEAPSFQTGLFSAYLEK